MKTRIIAGLSGLAVVLPAIIFGGTVAVEIIIPLVLLVCVTEYAAMAFPDDRGVASVIAAAKKLPRATTPSIRVRKVANIARVNS